MEAGLESVSLLATTFLRRLPNVSLFAGRSAFGSDVTRHKTRHLDVSKRFTSCQTIWDLIRCRSVASPKPTASTRTSSSSRSEDDSRITTLISVHHYPSRSSPSASGMEPKHLPVALQATSSQAIMHQTCLKCSEFKECTVYKMTRSRHGRGRDHEPYVFPVCSLSYRSDD